MRQRIAITTLLWFFTMLAVAASCSAQYTPIPNFSGPLAGQGFRNALNNKLSGSDTISPQLVHLNFSQLSGTVTNGQSFYINDGAPGTPCAGGGPGAIATGVNGVWSCGAVPGGASTPTSVSCSHKTTVVGAGTFTSGSTNTAGSFLTPNVTTDVDNCTITFSTPSATNRICGWRAMNADGTSSSPGFADTTTTTTAKVDFASSGGTTGGLARTTIGYTCF